MGVFPVFRTAEIIDMFNRMQTYIWKVKLNVKIISGLRKCLGNSKKNFAFRGPIKYFESPPPGLGQLGDGKRAVF